MSVISSQSVAPSEPQREAPSPRPLFAQPRTLYRGTDLDGATLDPVESLGVRGRDLNSLVGKATFEQAVWHLWHNRMPDAAEHAAVAALLGCGAGALQADPRWHAAIAAAAGAGADMIPAAAGGFLCDLAGVEAALRARGPELATDTLQGLVALACAPYFLRAAMDPASPPPEHASSHAARLLAAMDATRRDRAAEAAVDALLVAWHAGFGYVTPTVLVPRVAIGTGVSLFQAVGAGFLASGPLHVGAGEHAFRWLRDTHARGGDTAQAVDAALDSGARLLSGFGHPLFAQDPRPAHMRALLDRLGVAGDYLALYDAACARALARKGLRPNIDAITAATLLDLGVADPRWAVGLGLCARIAAMVAHAVERRDRPPFGVNSATARKLLAAVPVGWL